MVTDRATELQMCAAWGGEKKLELEASGFEVVDVRGGPDAEVVFFLNRETGVLEIYGAAMSEAEVGLATEAGFTQFDECRAADGREAALMHKSVKVDAPAPQEAGLRTRWSSAYARHSK